ncbi:hypothetical protein [Parasitella parasitica]|uniref:Uncharacterized protein n=1 Tax=Parasitella parasitica TaxID=35722 RepID=A0A0B7N9N6_9FUNG|nr:hypothetical protein [Parasitella parasitica]
MAKASTSVVADFDPLSPTLLRDPKYNGNIDTSFLQTEARRIYQERLLRKVQRVHGPSRQIAVARNFCFTHEWTTQNQYSRLYNLIKPAKHTSTSSQQSADDDHMNDATLSTNTVTTNGTPANLNSPADAPSDPMDQ